MEPFSNDHEDRLNQHENSHKQCDEMKHPVMNLLESQWKLRQQHDHPLKGKKIIVEQMNPKEQHFGNHSLGSD